jgi:hypothetical protein
MLSFARQRTLKLPRRFSRSSPIAGQQQEETWSLHPGNPHAIREYREQRAKSAGET